MFKKILQKIAIQCLGFCLLILLNIDTIVLAESEKDNEVLSETHEGTDKKEEKTNKNFLNILLFLILSGALIFFFYFNGDNSSSQINTIGDIIIQLQSILPKEINDKLILTIFEMENNPSKIKTGIQLLHIIKLFSKEHIVSEKKELFENLLNKIIKYFEEKK